MYSVSILLTGFGVIFFFLMHAGSICPILEQKLHVADLNRQLSGKCPILSHL